MKNADKVWKKSIFRSLIISFICILLPFYVLSITAYNWGIRTLRGEISNSMVVQVSNYLSGLENDIRRIQTLQYDCFSDQNLNQLAAIPEYLNDIEKMQSILRLQQRLSALKNSSKYINDVYAYIPAINKKISANTLDDLRPGEYDRLANIPLPTLMQLIEFDDQLLLCATYPYRGVKNEKSSIFTLVIDFSKTSLEGALNSMIKNNDEGIILINPSTQSIISTKYDSSFNNQILKLILNRKTQLPESAETVGINGRKYLLVYSESDYLGWVLCKYIPEDSVFKALSKYQLWFLLLTIVAVVIIMTYSMYMYNFIHKPLSRLVRAFKQVETGNFSDPIEHRHDDEFRYIYRRFNAMVERLDALIDQVYKQRILAQKAELKQLQSQINPHFLYNSFFILNTMSRLGDYENLEKFTEELGEYFQFVTRNASDEITLEKEVNHARVYTDIQAMRFSNRIKVEFDVLPEELAKIIVPRLILQPIIENAFEHGLEKKTSKGLLRISFFKSEDEVCITIEDNGEQLSDEELEKLKNDLSAEENKNEVTGIININQRIRLKFGAQSGLSVIRGELGGLKVILHIKLMEGDHGVQAAHC